MQFHYVNYSNQELAIVQELFEEYSRELGVDLCFQNFEQELQTLSKVYAAPTGCIIILYHEQQPAGCVALKPIAEGVCEMKRLYIRHAFRGFKYGKKLAQELILFAYKAGYSTMKLDTLTTLTDAIGLYRSMQFVETAPYVYNPLDNVLYFELNLKDYFQSKPEELFK
ncbi:GNAT family N-acetyltransferase [Cellulophaga sp. BC115SP]|uniref:GNAT family N-acetyltransferase n=1 Tax=Cellulophaga sp. BC115SP TaxID=2683263 RepID=UPI0014128A74|nr:GNAT family N-acetyltransferase [Cellulophaga sp. BC115SP]NBB26790.1 GNAT family N-acetyltransferase [Cellulophaga sp. BC115SP]